MSKILKKIARILAWVLAAFAVAIVIALIILPYNPAPLDAEVIHERVDLINEAAAILVPHNELDDGGSRAAHQALFDKVASGAELTEAESADYRNAYQLLLQHNQSDLARFDKNLSALSDVRMNDENNVGSLGISGHHDHHDRSIRSNLADLSAQLERVRHSSNPFSRVNNALKAYKDATDILLHAATVPQTKSVTYLPPETAPSTQLEVDVEVLLAEFKAAQFSPVNSAEYTAHVHAALNRYDVVVDEVQDTINAHLSQVERTLVGTWGNWQSLGPNLEDRVANRIPRDCLFTVDEMNGLNHCDRASFYHLPEGSELIPLAWLLAVKNGATGEPFLENIERFGMIRNPIGPSGLPIGLSISRPVGYFGLNVVGLNCAACHTGEFHYDDKVHRVDGAPSMIDVSAFLGDLIGELQRTVGSPQELTEFLVNLQTTTDSEPHVAHLMVDGADVAPTAPAAAAVTSEPLALSIEPMTATATTEEDLVAQVANIVTEEQAKLERQKTQTPQLLQRHTLRDDRFLALPSIPGEDGAPELFLHEFTIEDEVVDERLALTARTAGPDEASWTTYARGEIRMLLLRIEFLQNLAVKTADAEAGYGRLDAFGGARNLLFGADFGTADKTAPVSFPALWGFRDKAWLHWTANTNSVLERNIGQSLGLGAVFDPGDFTSTVEIESLHNLEVLARKIEAPAWPDIFPPIDENKANAGEQIYNAECAGCHNDGRAVGNGLIDYPLFSLDEIGTDPNAAMNFDAPVGDTAFHVRSAAVLAGIKGKYLAEHPDRTDLEFGREPVVWRSPLSDNATKPRVYPALPLDGIWARAPYLHNNSVASLHDLLLPPDDRPTSVEVGTKNFDPVKVGFEQGGDSSRLFVIDTTISGNSSGGHDYATDLAANEKEQLLEYLKTL